MEALVGVPLIDDCALFFGGAAKANEMMLDNLKDV